MTIPNIDVVAIVDDLGAIRANIANLERQKKALEESLKLAGPGGYDGELYRASVSEVAPTSSLDPVAAEAKLRELGVDGRWFSKNQKERSGYVTIRVTARKN